MFIRNRIKNTRTLNVTLTVNELYVIERKYKPLNNQQDVSFSSILKRPDIKGVNLLAEFILLNIGIFDFRIFSKEKPKKGLPYTSIDCHLSLKDLKKPTIYLDEHLQQSDIKKYKLYYVKEHFTKQANCLYPFWKGILYSHIRNPLNDQVYDWLDNLKHKIADNNEYSQISIKCKLKLREKNHLI